MDITKKDTFICLWSFIEQFIRSFCDLGKERWRDVDEINSSAGDKWPELDGHWGYKGIKERATMIWYVSVCVSQLYFVRVYVGAWFFMRYSHLFKRYELWAEWLTIPPPSLRRTLILVENLFSTSGLKAWKIEHTSDFLVIGNNQVNLDYISSTKET